MLGICYYLGSRIVRRAQACTSTCTTQLLACSLVLSQHLVPIPLFWRIARPKPAQRTTHYAPHTTLCPPTQSCQTPQERSCPSTCSPSLWARESTGTRTGVAPTGCWCTLVMRDSVDRAAASPRLLPWQAPPTGPPFFVCALMRAPVLMKGAVLLIWCVPILPIVTCAALTSCHCSQCTVDSSAGCHPAAAKCSPPDQEVFHWGFGCPRMHAHTDSLVPLLFH